MKYYQGRINALFTFLFFIGLFSVSSHLGAQIRPDERRVTVEFVDIPLDSALLLLSAKSSTGISFDPGVIPIGKTASLAANRLMLGLALDNVFVGTDLIYKIVGNQLVIKKVPPPILDQNITINGYMQDLETGEGLVYATISTLDASYGSSSNEYGYYSLTLPVGEYEIQYSYVGYEQQSVYMNMDKDTSININLQARTYLNEVVILGEVPKVSKNTEDYDQMPIELLNGMATLAGEADIIRMAQMRSGVSSQVDGFGGLQVRGGSTDQNLILLDGVPVYNTGHALGLFSIFNSSAIKSAKLIKGGFPSRYGGRLSSVLDVRIKDGNNQYYGGDVAISPLMAKATIEGPILKGKSSFLLSARRTIIDPWLKPLSRYQFERNNEDGQINFLFYDINAKINFQLGDKNQIYLSGYVGKDRYFNEVTGTLPTSLGGEITEFDQTDVNWGNDIATLRWTSNFGKKIFGYASLSYSGFNFDNFDFGRTIRRTNDNNSTESFTSRLFSSDIEDYIASYDLDWYVNTNYYLRLGLNYTRHRLTPGSDFTINNDDILNDNGRVTIDDIKNLRTFESFTGNEFRAYIENEIRIGKRFSGNIGGHFSSITIGGTNYTRLQPRLSIQWKIDERFRLKGGYSEMNQYFHLLSRAGLGLPSDVWLPSTEVITPESSRQISISAEASIFKDWTIRMSAYDKKYNNITDYAQGSFLDISGDVDWQDDVPIGIGTSRGLEFEVEKRVGRYKGWVSYTLSKSEREFEALNGGKVYRAQNDRRHLINIIVISRLNTNMELSLGWTYGSSLATSAPTEIIPVVINDQIAFVPIITNLNDVDLPPYHKLDVGFNLYNKYGWGRQKFSIGAYNVYARKNPFYLDLVLDESGNPSGLEQISILPLIPYLSFGLSF